MAQSKRQKIISCIRRNFRYIFVVFLLISIYLFGGNYQPVYEQPQVKVSNLLAKNIYRMYPSVEYIEVDVMLSTKKDTYYRLSFETKVLPDLEKLRLENKSSSESSDQIDINVGLRGILGERKDIGQVVVLANSQFTPKEVIFVADNNYQNIIFQRSDAKEKSQIDFSSIRISPINCSNIQCIENLRATINGKNQEIVQSFSSGELTNRMVKFRRENQLIGRIIQLDFDQIESVDMAIRKTGTGGLGNYRAVLFNIREEKNGWQIGSSPISTLYFTPDDLADYQVDNDIYRFPLAARLQKGEKYFLGISNFEVEFNSLNNLDMILSSGNYSVNEKVTSKSLKLANKNIYLVINSYKYSSDFGSKPLINGKLEDLGFGDGLYSYRFSHSSADFLDIENIFYEKEGDFVYRDNISDGISIPVPNGSGVIYKFDTIYPFSQFILKISQLGGENTTGLIYYSYDSSNWELVYSLENDRNKFEKMLVGDGIHHQIYIKMIPNSYDKNKIIKLFTVRDIDISASVKFLK